MSHQSDQDLKVLRQATRKFVDEKVIPLLQKSEAADEMSQQLLDLIRDQGYSGLRIAPNWGGKGLSFVEYSAVLQEFGRAGPSLLFWLGDSLGMSLQNFGSVQQKEKYLRPYSAWQLKGCLGFTEPEAGSDAAALRTHAVKVAGGWLINGGKHYISRGHTADFALVTAMTDAALGARGGITTFLVDRGTPGFSVGRIETSMGSALHKLAELHFDECFVPDDAVLGTVGQGFVAAMKTLNDGRLAVSSTCVGASERLIELMVEQAITRETFGTRLADRQGIRWMVADSWTELELGRALLKASMTDLQEGRDLGVRASVCKLHCSEMVNRIADRAVQMMGAAGLMRGNPVEQFYRDVRFFRIGEGSSEIQRIVIARALLGRPARMGD